jgi:hypothetical protein
VLLCSRLAMLTAMKSNDTPFSFTMSARRRKAGDLGELHIYLQSHSRTMFCQGRSKFRKVKGHYVGDVVSCVGESPRTVGSFIYVVHTMPLATEFGAALSQTMTTLVVQSARRGDEMLVARSARRDDEMLVAQSAGSNLTVAGMAVRWKSLGIPMSTSTFKLTMTLGN